MVLLISLSLAFCISWFGAKGIKKHANLLYMIATMLSIGMVVVSYNGLTAHFPTWVRSYVWPVFANCALATAFFIVVMMMGALPNGSAAIKRLMPIRAELSILACILTLGHNISYGKSYFVLLFTKPERLSGGLLWAAICSVVLICIMLPLMITSFPKVRKKMKAKSWKKLQRTAYLFYALIYVHVLLLNTTFLSMGQTKYIWNILLYSVVFVTYAAMRIRKALKKKQSVFTNSLPTLVTCAGVLLVAVLLVPHVWPETKEQNVEFELAGEPETPLASADETLIEDIREDENVADENSEETVSESIADVVVYQDGTYFGVGEGFNGDVQVAVMITNGSISSIIPVSHSDDQPFFNNAVAITEEMIATQSADVDAVSGATYSSKGIMAAVKDALSQAVQ